MYQIMGYSLTAADVLGHIRRYADGHNCNPVCLSCQIAEAAIRQRAESGTPAPLNWPKWARERVENYNEQVR